jgi:hypothetical protein
MEQTLKPYGLDHYGKIITVTGQWSSGCGDRRTGPTGAMDTVRNSRRVGPAASVVFVWTVHGPAIVLLRLPEALGNGGADATRQHCWLKSLQVNRHDGILAQPQGSGRSLKRALDKWGATHNYVAGVALRTGGRVPSCDGFRSPGWCYRLLAHSRSNRSTQTLLGMSSKPSRSASAEICRCMASSPWARKAISCFMYFLSVCGQR